MLNFSESLRWVSQNYAWKKPAVFFTGTTHATMFLTVQVCLLLGVICFLVDYLRYTAIELMEHGRFIDLTW